VVSRSFSSRSILWMLPQPAGNVDAVRAPGAFEKGLRATVYSTGIGSRRISTFR